jgi:hypothetical protein
MDPLWKSDWARTRARFVDWWEHRGLVFWVTAPRSTPLLDVPEPQPPVDVAQMWLDPAYRGARNLWTLSHTYFGGESFPFADTNIGPGSVANFLGSEPGYAADTVWYEPCIPEPDACPPLVFDPGNIHVREHLAVIEGCRAAAGGRYPVCMPDLIENLDILAALRDPQTCMFDLIERPDWVKAKIAEINAAYFAAFDCLYEQIKLSETDGGGNVFAAFNVWGPGKTAKLQCDASAMISAQMYAELVSPALEEQCRWLDYSLYHLDGTQACHQVDNLLAIEHLNAIEWTPQAGRPGGGDPCWYDLYRRILAGGKGVQAIGAAPNEVIPLLDAVGPQGLYIMTWARNEDEARALEEQVDKYR